MLRRLDSNEDSYQGRDHKNPVAIEGQLKAERAGRDRNSKSGNHKLMNNKTGCRDTTSRSRQN